ncbi:putative toxin-antitoxin system toxin component, PIN family [Desulfobacterales bacterium HSG17]|nr:putative toxin-antitoxin system toxin component, PIN family [Desulfobacterales bacterium HSG17]
MKKKRIRAVIDTNLFISGFFSEKGYTCELQELWIADAFELVVSEKILKEIKNTLLKPHIRDRLNLEKEEAEELVDLISEKAFIVTKDSYQTDKIRKDMDDNKFLACALETGADYIVSGDNDLLELKHYHRIQIVDIRIFIEKIK